MSIQIVDANYVPDLDSARVPGAIYDMTGFAPLQRGPYGSISRNEVFEVAGSDIVHAETFRQIDDSVRLLVFRKTEIAEYTYAGVPTTQGSGYSASTTGWSAAAWGNYIYACNKLDATQVSTGTTFAAVGDDCPKARYVSSNVNFVMLADTDDGSDDLPDQVWWSALQNPTEWTPAIATQAGKVRLLDAPGPIKALVAFRDLFVAFKENAIFVGEYVGPPFIFQWRLVSSRIGLASENAVVELDGALFFMHTSGFYRWDGNELRNIGLPVFGTFLSSFNFYYRQGAMEVGYTGTPLSGVRAIADDIEGIAWWSCYVQSSDDPEKFIMELFGYNARTNKWARSGTIDTSGDKPQVLIATNHSDMRTFLSTNMGTNARVWYIDNTPDDESESGFKDLSYPAAWNDITGSVMTAVQGTLDKSTDALRVYTRCVNESSEAPFDSCTLYGYANEQRQTGAQSVACVLNAELDCFDGRLNARFKQVKLTGSRAKTCLLAGVGIEYPQTGSR